MAIRDDDEPGRRRPRPPEGRPTALESIEDSRRALRLLDRLAHDGWRVDWSRSVDGSWRARLWSPALGFLVEGRGLSRVSAISAAHLRAIRLDRPKSPLA